MLPGVTFDRWLGGFTPAAGHTKGRLGWAVPRRCVAGMLSNKAQGRGAPGRQQQRSGASLHHALHQSLTLPRQDTPLCPCSAAPTPSRHLALRHPPTRPSHPCQATPTLSAAPLTPTDGLEGPETAVLWFRHDLRTDDHPALHAAAASSTLKQVACLYVVDATLLRPLLSRPAGPEILVAALTSLRSQLRHIGSDLIIRTGDAAAAVEGVISEIRSSSSSSSAAGSWLPIAVLTEAEAPGSAWTPSLHPAAETPGSSRAAAGASDSQPPAQLGLWQSSAWAPEPFDINYRRWQAIRGRPLDPLDPPSRLPPTPAGIAPGEMPSAEQLRQLLGPSAGGDTHAPDARDLEADVLHALAACGSPPLALLSSYLTAPSGAAAGTSAAALRQGLSSMLERRSSNSGSNSSPSAGERSYEQLIGEAAEALATPAVPGGSFRLLLGPWMELGALSRRRVLHRAGAGAGAGVLPSRADAARRSAEVSDFHHLLAERGAGRGRPDGVPDIRVVQWAWRGMRNEYCVAEPTSPWRGTGPAPAVLLVHGFGAFGDQWRGNMAELAASGLRVFAPTLPGFGRSEKAPVPYSQDMWRDFLRDFSEEVVGTKVVLVGNSIGGFIAASLAADHPRLVAGLVLLNSAGPIEPGFSVDAWRRACAAKTPPPRLLVQVLSRALYWYLEGSIAGTLKWLYPTNPARADQWLGDEIFRAACDPGSLEVFQSVFYLPPPRALNYLVSELFRGPTMVLQGVLDPLNDARGRARDMQLACTDNVEVVLLEAGHCPHDEQPEMVNRELLGFIQRRVLLEASVAELAVA